MLLAFLMWKIFVSFIYVGSFRNFDEFKFFIGDLSAIDSWSDKTFITTEKWHCKMKISTCLCQDILNGPKQRQITFSENFWTEMCTCVYLWVCMITNWNQLKLAPILIQTFNFFDEKISAFALLLEIFEICAKTFCNIAFKKFHANTHTLEEIWR